MTYFVLQVLTYNDGTDMKKSLLSYDSYAEAVGNFHTYLGSAMKTSNVAKATVMAFDENGNMHKNECWVAPVEETTEQTTEDTSEEA